MSRYSTTIWKPPTVVCVKLFHAVEVGGSGWPLWETITCVAARIELMPSVAMNEFTPSLTTMNALTQPMMIATTMPNAIAGTGPQWWSFIRTTVVIADEARRRPDRQVVETGRERNQDGEGHDAGHGLLGGDAVERRGGQELVRHPDAEDDDEQRPEVQAAEAVEAGVELPAAARASESAR